MKLVPFIFLISFCLYTTFGFSQYEFSGYVDTATWEGKVYLSVVEDYRKISGVHPEQIINRTTPDSTGFFFFSGINLPSENRLYRIHIDTCLEIDQNTAHFTGYCPNSKEIVFVANNTDTLSLPFSFDNQMFCKVLSKNEKADALIKIDSLKDEMRFAFGTYRSEANRKINSKKWFGILQQYGEQLNEPLAELYSYAYLSDRTNDLYSFYLEDLKTNGYYNQLQERLQDKYPKTQYAQQFSSELEADKFIISAKKRDSLPWWAYLLVTILLISLLMNFYYFGIIKKLKQNIPSLGHSLSKQEKKVLDLILEDKSNKEIASEMFVSLSTVKSHINNLYKKLQVSSRDEVKQLFK